MALTAAEQQEYEELKRLDELENIDQLRTSGQSAYDSMSNTGKFGVGVAKGAINTWYGLRDLFGSDLSKEEQETLERLAGTEGGWSTAGEVTGDLAAFALPAAGLSKFITGIGKYAPSLLTKLTPSILKKSAPLLADMGLTVGAEGIKAPTEGTTRTDRMQDAAKGYAATALGLKALGKTANAFRPSEAGSRMLKEGIPLTPGQASDNPIIQGVEETLGALPFVSQNVQAMQNRSLGEWNNVLLNEANPLSDRTISEVGSGGFKQLQNNFKRAYGNAYDNVKTEDIDFNRLFGMMDFAKNNASGNIGLNAVNPTKKTLNDAASELERFYKTDNINALEGADDILRKFKSDDRNANEIIKKVRDEIKNSLGKSGQQLRDVDQKYAKYSILRDAATSTKDPLQSDLIIAPANLTGGMKKSATPNQLLREEGFYQEAAQDATDTFGKTRPGNNMLRRIAGGASTAGLGFANLPAAALSLAGARVAASEPVRKAVTGGMRLLDKQKEFAEILRKNKTMTPEELNRILNRAGGFTAAAGDTEGYE